MIVEKLVSALAVALLVAAPARAQDALVTYNSLSPELALDLARGRRSRMPQAWLSSPRWL